jgi:ParB family transcriptional regulator, chromosome partitioning protein
MSIDKKKGLGRGLDALFQGNIDLENNANANANANAINNVNGKLINYSNNILKIYCSDIVANPKQPRKYFDEASLQELADSIKQNGLLQPIVVQLNSDIGIAKYTIIAGERRWRACKIAEIEYIDAIVKEIDEQQQAMFALIENIQRDNLNVIEEAKAFKQLQQDYALSHEQISIKVGKSRSHITNILRILNLNEDVQNMLLEKKIDMGHAKVLLSLPLAQQISLANVVSSKNWSVRALEKHIQDNEHTYIYKENNKENNKEINKEDEQSIIYNNTKQYSNTSNVNNNDIKILADELGQKISTEVKIETMSDGSGKLIIYYASLDSLDEIISMFNIKK